MRDPFSYKNPLDSEREAPAAGEAIAFEESFGDPEGGSRLERADGPAARPFRFLQFLVLLFLGVALWRLYFLGILQHDYYRAVADGNRLRVEYLPAPRGTIYDRNGEVIAGNRPSFELVASPLDLPAESVQKQEVIARVARVVGLPDNDIAAAIESAEIVTAKFESVLIKQNLTREEALVLSEQAGSLPGFRVAGIPIRDYKDAATYAHMAGYVGKISPAEYAEKSGVGYLFNDSLGKTGLEQVYEEYLRGQFGQRQVEVDARGAVKKVFGEKPAAAGSDLVLNLDAGLQRALYEALTLQLSAAGKKKAAAIAMDPRDGRILAYVSLPGFDNNAFAEGVSQAAYASLLEDKNQPLFNRAIGGAYPPGSTVKPMVASAALQEGVVSERTVVDDRGYILVPNVFGGPDYYFYGYNRAGLGPVNVRRAIALSSDIYFYSVGGGYEKEKIEGLGIERLARYYREYKLGEKLGIDLPGEAAGLVPTPEWKKMQFAGNETLRQWYLGDTYHVAIGQGDLLATPLQVLSWTASIASGGKVYRPFIVERVQIPNGGDIIKRFEPQFLGQLPISGENLRVVREGMRQTVTEGTARSLGQIAMPVAGKTGTAQFDSRNLSRAHAWFAGFAPFDNPEIAIVVLIEDGGEGSTNAVPVARAALDWWAKNRWQK